MVCIGKDKRSYCPAFSFQYIFHPAETMRCPGTAEAAVRDSGFPAGGWAWHTDVKNALLREDFSDFEDCLQDESAKKAGADYIVTRNIQDFKYAAVKAVTPEEFIKLLSVR